MVLLVKVCL